jgi:uncharacterized protein YeaO (DUF488 family)
MASKAFQIKLKRTYEPALPRDGVRVLVERLWPRGLTKEKAAIALWAKDISPSPKLRQWFGHKPERWDKFRRDYWKELENHPEAIAALKDAIKSRTVTFVFAAKDTGHNSAIVLRDFILSSGIESKLVPPRTKSR